MFFVPAWLTNIVFLLIFYLATFEHVKMRRPNPVLNLQFFMMAFSLLAIVGLGFTVWAHHMFTSGMANWIRIPMAITTSIIAVIFIARHLLHLV